jgi:hypothetical protein
VCVTCRGVVYVMGTGMQQRCVVFKACAAAPAAGPLADIIRGFGRFIRPLATKSSGAVCECKATRRRPSS